MHRDWDPGFPDDGADRGNPPPSASEPDCGNRKCRKKGRCGCEKKKCAEPVKPPAPSGILQTKYMLVQAKTIPQGIATSLLSLPITVTTGILEILITYSFTCNDMNGTNVQFRLDVDGAAPVLISSANTVQARDASGAMVYSTRFAPLHPGNHTINLGATSSIGNALIIATQGHVAMYVQETGN